MIKEIEDLLKEVERLSILLTSKGYDGMFQTNGSYPGKLRDSVERYLHQTIFGDEKGLNAGISLKTYAQWKDEESDYVQCSFSFRLDFQNKLAISAMTIDYRNRYANPIKELKLHFLPGAEIPTRKEALAKVMAPQESITKPKRLKV